MSIFMDYLMSKPSLIEEKFPSFIYKMSPIFHQKNFHLSPKLVDYFFLHLELNCNNFWNLSKTLEISVDWLWSMNKHPCIIPSCFPCYKMDWWDLFLTYSIGFRLSTEQLNAWEDPLVWLTAVELRVNLKPWLWLDSFSQVTKTVLELEIS